MIPVIGLMGKMHSGKSTAANYLIDVHEYTSTRFAGPLKAMLSGYLEACGIDSYTIIRMISGDLKEVPTDALSGRTPRHAMQTLGTDWGRDLMAASLWTDAWKKSADRLIRMGALVCVDDCRFLNEAVIIRERGGVIIELVNLSLPKANASAAAHISETMDFAPDHIVKHDGVNFSSLFDGLEAVLLSAQMKDAA